MQSNLDVIFISSTYEDLQPYRQKVIDSLQSISANFHAMEYFCATPQTPKQECLERVASSNIFILILGMRYGSIDPKTGKSYVRLEYEKALETGSTILAFLIDIKRQPILLKNVDTGVAAEKLQDFKEAVTLRFHVSYFTTPDNLATRVLEALQCVWQHRKFSFPVSSDTIPSEHSSHPPTRTRASWQSYQGLFHLDQYHAAYIPIINTPTPDLPVREFCYSDIDVHIDTDPYTLPQEFASNKSYEEGHDGKSCRLSSYTFNEGGLKLFISKTSYWDYLRSGEHLDDPYIHDHNLTNRDIFGSKLHIEWADFTLFNLTNICGCGLFILTADNKLLIAKQSELSSVYPGRFTYTTSGTMHFGNYPNPFTEILFKSRQEIDHQIDLNHLCMIGFGADARKLYFQFSFLEKVPHTFADLQKQHKNIEFKPINFHPGAVIEHLVHKIWEPAAEATLLTLLIKEYGYQMVMDELARHRQSWSRRDIKDEWDYRAACGGDAAALSIRYPRGEISTISHEYINQILMFMEQEHDIDGKDILEVGSGDGRVTGQLICAGAAHVTCVDICERMINKSKRALEPYCDKITYENVFAQAYERDKPHDVAVLSLVLIHNVDEKDFQDLIENICQYARVIYVFEDVTQDRPTSPYTKLRPKEKLIPEFQKYDFIDVKQAHYRLVDDDILFIKFIKKEKRPYTGQTCI